MDLVLVGLNHKTAPIEIREKVAFSEAGLCKALHQLRSDFGFDEAMIVSTCNRVEVFARSTENGSSTAQLSDFLCAYHGISAEELGKHLYSYGELDLVRHIFRVASSLDSMVPGEAQILGQLKQAYTAAQEAGTIGRTLCRLLPHAFFVAKRVRNETRVANSAVSVSSVAVELARKIFGDLDGQVVLLLGAGTMSELAAQSLLQSGAGQILVTNRTYSRATEIAGKFDGTAIPYEDLETALVRSDIVIVSTGASGFILNPDMIERALRKRRYSPLFLVDISVPRNVNPAINEIENAFLYDIDDLQTVISSNLEERAREAELAEEIVAQEVASFNALIQRQRVGPIVSAFRHKLEQICLEELDQDRASYTEEEYARAQKLLRRAAHRIAHPIMMQMKNIHENPARHYHNLEMIRDAFELEKKNNE